MSNSRGFLLPKLEIDRLVTIEDDIQLNYDCRRNTRVGDKEWCVEGLGTEINTYTNYKVCREQILGELYINNSLCSDNLKSYEKLFWVTLIK